jgi:hypothetical protein
MRMERVEYQVRAHVLDKTRTFRLGEHDLEIDEERAAPVRLELSSISEIRLRYQPTKSQSNRYQCSFIAAGKKYHFISMHFRGLLDFEDRAAAYSTFCRELCSRVARRNPAMRCVGGHGALMFYIGLTVGILGMVGFIAFMAAFWEAMHSLHFMRVVMLIFLTFLVVKYFIGNRPRLFDPTALPADALPKQI